MSEFEQGLIDTEAVDAATAGYQAKLTELKVKTPVAYLDGFEVYVEFSEELGHDIFIWNAELLEAVAYIHGDATTDNHIKALIEEYGIDSVEEYVPREGDKS